MRLISYTLLGAIFGYFGELLKNSLEMELIGAISFSIFTLVSLIFVFPFLFPKLKNISPLTSFTDIRGVLWGLVPCHLLYFYYGVAILSGSSVTGALLLFIHATMSAPALLFLSATAQRFYKKSGVVSIAIKSVLVTLLTFNLIYFWLVFTNGKEIAEKLILNCF